jgi:hypothetical protein
LTIFIRIPDSMAGLAIAGPGHFELAFLTWSYGAEVVVTNRQFGNGVAPIIICDGILFCGLAT